MATRFGINTDTGKESERWKVGLIGDRDEAVHGMGPSTKFPISVCFSQNGGTREERYQAERRCHPGDGLT